MPRSQPEGGTVVTDEARVHKDNAAVNDVGEGAAEHAADHAINEDRLLDGEDLGTPYADDVAHWIAAYSELIAYKESLIAKSKQEMATMVSPAASINRFSLHTHSPRPHSTAWASSMTAFAACPVAPTWFPRRACIRA